MEVSLLGRKALITGGSSGTGYAMAAEFVRSGASVAIIARGQEALDKARAELAKLAAGHVKTAKVVAYSCDVGVPAQRAATYAKVREALGVIDILCNNAGESRSGGTFENIPEENWRLDMETKTMAHMHFARLCWDDMKAQKRGVILNTGAISAKAGRPAAMPTSVARAGVMALTKGLAFDGGPYNIRANALLIGSLETGQTVRHYPNEAERKAALLKSGEHIPLGRVGSPEEFANLACFLASDKASYITGCAINVDGGSCPVV